MVAHDALTCIIHVTAHCRVAISLVSYRRSCAWQLSCVCLLVAGHDNKGLAAAWHLDHVEVIHQVRIALEPC